MGKRKAKQPFKEERFRVVGVGFENRKISREEILLLLHSRLFARVREVAFGGMPGPQSTHSEYRGDAQTMGRCVAARAENT